MAGPYKVTDVKQRERFTSGGSKVSYYDISVVTDQGATGTLRIDTKDYNPVTVKQLLEEFVAGLDMPFGL